MSETLFWLGVLLLGCVWPAAAMVICYGALFTAFACMAIILFRVWNE